MKPVYKIETYTDAVKDHTIEHDVKSIKTKEILTNAIGYFQFVVPTKKGTVYEDIALNDKVKVWYGWGTVSGDPDFIGRVGNISAPLNAQSGYVRVISGLSQGEILLRRQNKNKYYASTGASTIVTEWATDLSLGTGDIAADATAVTLGVETKSYFDLLRFISDYWASAGTQIKKDFYVDVDNDLVWKARPFRSGATVETLTVGDNILNYKVTQDVEAVKNNIEVWGHKYNTPSNQDGYTESTTNWTSDGTLATDSAVKKRGLYSVRATKTGSGLSDIYMQRTFSSIKCGGHNHRYLKCQIYLDGSMGLGYGSSYALHCLAPDWSNHFRKGVNTPPTQIWIPINVELGPLNQKSGEWVVGAGSPDWDDVQGFRLLASGLGTTSEIARVDELYFADQRYYTLASDGTSQSTYGVRDAEFIDDKLRSDSDCEKRAETLLYMRKEPPVQIEATTPGNTNILVGDRLSMTLPAEGITAQNYDVFSVENTFSEQTSWITKATMVNTANIRKPITTNAMKMLGDLRRQLKELNLDEKGIT